MKRHIITETAAAEKSAFDSSAFTDVIFARRSADEPQPERRTPSAGEIAIRVKASGITPSQSLRIVGECDALGCWDTARALELSDAEFPVWSIVLPSDCLPERLEYKFIVTDRASGRLVAWEEGYNRIFDYFRPAEDESLTVEVRAFANPAKWHGAGTAVPVFSLRSEQGFGTGEFADLKLLADWAAATGQRVIQILPVNDTTCRYTWRDSYPYNANSIYALHPQYIRLEDVGVPGDKRLLERFETLKRELNALPTLDYERVNMFKHEYLRAVYAEQGGETFETAEYKAFFDANARWLKPYAVYSVLRDRFDSADFSKWGDMAVYDGERVDAFIASNGEDAGYWFFIQYHLDRQLREARNYAHSRGVILKGDIPIGISRTSVDAWSSPELFRMDFSAGAPPDDFAVKGQNWGFPTYDWERMAEDGYAWWRARFIKMNDYFDAYRIDHILGFFRIWEIPRNAVSALLGHFNPAMPMSAEEIADYGFTLDPERHTAPVDDSDDVLFVEDPQRAGLYHPRIAAQYTSVFKTLTPREQDAYNRLSDDFFFRRHNEMWRSEALRKLTPLVSSTRMLVCGEDLGMIPACVPDVMRELHILSLEIERMPKQYGAEFGTPAEYPYMSVCSPSTHDTSNIRAWLDEDMGRRERYFDILGVAVGKSCSDCTPEVCEKILQRQLSSASMLAIIPLQDWLSTDGALRHPHPQEERINVPADSQQYWRYRMHITLEALIASETLNERIRRMIADAGRA